MKGAYLVYLDICVRVEVDVPADILYGSSICARDEFEGIVGNAAIEKIMADPSQVIHRENIVKIKEDL